jgi:hypothetical protein
MISRAELAVESRRLLARMEHLQVQFDDAKALGLRPSTEILEQMEVTSRRFRELSRKMNDVKVIDGAVA